MCDLMSSPTEEIQASENLVRCLQCGNALGVAHRQVDLTCLSCVSSQVAPSTLQSLPVTGILSAVSTGLAIPILGINIAILIWIALNPRSHLFPDYSVPLLLCTSLLMLVSLAWSWYSCHREAAEPSDDSPTTPSDLPLPRP